LVVMRFLHVPPGLAEAWWKAMCRSQWSRPIGGSRSKRTKNNAPLVHGQAVEENEGLRPHIRWTKTPDFVHVYRGISSMNRVFFPTSATCLVRPPKSGESFKDSSKYNYFQRVVVFCSKTTGTPNRSRQLKTPWLGSNSCT